MAPGEGPGPALLPGLEVCPVPLWAVEDPSPIKDSIVLGQAKSSSRFFFPGGNHGSTSLQFSLPLCGQWGR